MVDFVVGGNAQTPSNSELNWYGGRGSFIVNGTGFADAQLLAEFNPGAGPQVIDGALTVVATGVVNFELPQGAKLSVALDAGGGSFEYVAARRITEVGST